MSILAITQARTGSTRLPGKVLKVIQNKTLLDIHLERIKKAKKVDQLLVATTIEPEDEIIAHVAVKHHLPYSRGSVSNVLDRFYQAALPYNPTWIVRLTSDCPLIDPALIDLVIDKAVAADVDYCSNTLNPTFPDGMDVEVFKFSALQKSFREASLHSEKEHVTPFIHQNSSFFGETMFKSLNFENTVNYSKVRLTVDEASDFEVIKTLIEKLGMDEDWKTYADYYLSNDLVNKINNHIKRNEGYDTSLEKN